MIAVKLATVHLKLNTGSTLSFFFQLLNVVLTPLIELLFGRHKKLKIRTNDQCCMHPAKREFLDIVTPKYIYSQKTIKGQWKMCQTTIPDF